MNHRPSSGKLVVSAVVSMALVAGALLCIVYRESLYDQLRVWQFQPSVAIAGLATRTGMSDGGRHVFYASEPELANANTFNQSCGEHEHSTAILGCYVGKRIYIYDVDNDELTGIKEVTAAHEMLHAAYERLSNADRQRVDQMITAYLPTLQRDKAFVERMKVYDTLSEADRLNELHSVIGTEVEQLSSDLEAHYAAYFANRSRVTTLYMQYSAVFTKLQARADELAAEYNRIASARNALVEQSNREYEQLLTDMDVFERGSRTDTAQAAALNARADRYNATLDTAKQQVTEYDNRLHAIKSELNQISVHTQTLQNSIDSTAQGVR